MLHLVTPQLTVVMKHPAKRQKQDRTEKSCNFASETKLNLIKHVQWHLGSIEDLFHPCYGRKSAVYFRQAWLPAIRHYV